MGTVGYMSPEQVRGAHVDHRSDIFSFGAILYEMLTGQRAFQGETAAETMTAILKEDPRDLNGNASKISLPIEKILRRCLQKKPEQRFQSAQDLAFALEALATISGSRPELRAAASSKHGFVDLQNARLAWMVAAALLIALLVTLAFAISRFRQNGRASSPIVRYDVTTPDKSILGLVRWHLPSQCRRMDLLSPSFQRATVSIACTFGNGTILNRNFSLAPMALLSLSSRQTDGS
jgi:serine/threonine protein kinase